MCREVSRPLLLRPPLLFFGSVRLLTGLDCDLVTSWNIGSDLKRSVGVSGRKFLRAIRQLNEIDLLAFLQSYDRFFPVGLAPEISASLALLFAGVIAGIHVHHFFLKKNLDRVPNLDLVGARVNPEDVLVELLAQERRLLGQLHRL